VDLERREREREQWREVISISQIVLALLDGFWKRVPLDDPLWVGVSKERR
jgi:hypothetical protein